jgi:RTX calcium-binding nonapeptide repeat (4 copies)
MRTVAGVLALAACCLVPQAASAATISSDGTITFRSGAEASDLVILPFDPMQILYAGGPLTVGAGCLAGPPVTCEPGDLDARLGAGDDRKKGPVSSFLETVYGGPGRDEIFAGGIGNTVRAGSGDDIAIISNDGRGDLAGNGGDDRLESFGDGLSTVSGGPGDDIVVGNGADNDDLSGGPGRDVLVSTRSSSRFFHGDADGGSGSDVISAPATGPRLPWTWTMNGGAGADTILGSPGTDTISGGNGNDAIDVSGDGQADTVGCGSGHDTVAADEDDVVAADCERVIAGPVTVGKPAQSALDGATAFVERATHLNLESPGPLLAG